MAILGVVDIWNPGEARRKQRPHGYTTFGAGSPWILASRHVEHWLIPEERHDLVEVLNAEVGMIEARLTVEAFERETCVDE